MVKTVLCCFQLTLVRSGGLIDVSRTWSGTFDFLLAFKMHVFISFSFYYWFCWNAEGRMKIPAGVFTTFFAFQHLFRLWAELLLRCSGVLVTRPLFSAPKLIASRKMLHAHASFHAHASAPPFHLGLLAPLGLESRQLFQARLLFIFRLGNPSTTWHHCCWSWIFSLPDLQIPGNMLGLHPGLYIPFLEYAFLP